MNDNKLLVTIVLLLLAYLISKQCSPSNMEGYENDMTLQASNSDDESLIYDNVTGCVMSGTQFMDHTGINAPRWVAPAWAPDAHGPSSLGELNPSDYENDPRMLYNKCSLSCCSEQYPTPFQTVKDPFVFDENGKLKFLTSNYNCTNNAGGTGCLCMTEQQADGLQNGFVDYYANEKLGF